FDHLLTRVTSCLWQSTSLLSGGHASQVVVHSPAFMHRSVHEKDHISGTSTIPVLIPFRIRPSVSIPGTGYDRFMGSSSNFGTAIDHSFTSAGSSNLPMLPPPPPESPPSMSPAVGQLSEPGPSAPRSRRRQEVDVGNILHTARSRAPSKRFAEYEASEDVAGPPQKKAKSKKIAYIISGGHADLA
ncbi:hypothetical protein B0H12DRAFT_1310427, partial [Mycena haematopus]